MDVTAIQHDPGLVAALEELARKRWIKEALQAQIDQYWFARHCRDVNALDGMGEIRRSVHAFAFHDWAWKLGKDNQPDYSCWRDTYFTDYFDRLAPECKIKSKGTRFQVGFQGPCEWFLPLGPRQEPRFRKAYPSERLDNGQTVEVSA